MRPEEAQIDGRFQLGGSCMCRRVCVKAGFVYAFLICIFLFVHVVINGSMACGWPECYVTFSTTPSSGGQVFLDFLAQEVL